MIQIENNKISFQGMGLFSTQNPWIHPKRIEKTYEIIYVVCGTVYLKIADMEFSLKKKDLIILPPNILHSGFRQSYGHTSFYWVHLSIDSLEHFCMHSTVLNDFSNASLFKELLHYSNETIGTPFSTDIILSHLLAEISYDACKTKSELANSKLTSEIYEYVRINAKQDLTVAGIAEVYGYNGEYISRLMKKRYQKPLKSLIDEAILQKTKDFLTNSLYSVKQISGILGFKTPNHFINFYKYHENSSPTQYRNFYHKTHMNNQ